jgi:hypothetical protein
MRLKLILAIHLAVLCLFSISSPSIASEIKCPSSITETPTVSITDKRWTVVANSGERPLEHVGIYLGTLSENGAQVPASTKKAKRKETVTWNIKRSLTDTFWVGCSYVGTTAVLFQELDSSVTLCAATYDLLSSGRRQRLSTLDCQ